MTSADDVILELKADFIAEALDLVYTHAAWGSRHFNRGDYDRGLYAFDNLVTAVRAAAVEAKAMKAALIAQKANGDAAADWRRDRDRRGVSVQCAPKPPPQNKVAQAATPSGEAA